MDTNANRKWGIPIFTASEWFRTPKLDSALKVYQDKEFYQLRFQVC